MTLIANALNRHRATIYRELKRNCCHHIDNSYRPSKAEYRAKARRSKLRCYTHFTESNYTPLRALLRKKWSPEQISRMLNSLGFQRMHLSSQSIHRQPSRRGSGWPEIYSPGTFRSNRPKYNRFWAL
jgi:IS30 family transposase